MLHVLKHVHMCKKCYSRHVLILHMLHVLVLHMYHVTKHVHQHVLQLRMHMLHVQYQNMCHVFAPVPCSDFAHVSKHVPYQNMLHVHI